MKTNLHALSPAERRTIINTLFVERSGCTEILDRIEDLRQGHREGAETKCMLVLGEPGVGKSSLLRKYAESNPIVEERTATEITRRQPVVYVVLDSNTTVLAAAETIMREMMGERSPIGRIVKDRLLPAQLQLRRTEMLILDEFQHVAETGAVKTRSRTADWVKSITKKLRIPIVMAGIPSMGPIIADNGQLSSITPYRFVIPAYDVDSPEDRETFGTFLGDVDKRLPFRELAKLAEPGRATMLHVASGGVLRHLAQIISAAGRMAIEDDAGRIGDCHLHYACEDMALHPSCPGNPFPVPPDGS